MQKTRSMKSLAVLTVLLFIVNHPSEDVRAQTELSLIPKPADFTMGEGKLVIGNHFSIAIEGERSSLLEHAETRFLKRLQKRTGIPLIKGSTPSSGSSTLEIICIEKGEPIQSVSTDESYALEVSNAKIRLTAASQVGVVRGLETLLQLVDIDENSFFIPSIAINDRPRFKWRGILIDVSRHFQPVEIIKKNLDAMAAVKMNVLHWHLSDDQGFRVESHSFPKLHLLGSDGEYYRQEEILEIIDYARNLGIRIVPEFDMPGHSTSWFVGYPELAAASGPYKIERKWGVFEPCMDPSNEEVYWFLDTFIEEMAGLFPDEYFHIGGDEVKTTQWNASESIAAFKTRNKLADNRALQSYFNRRLYEILMKHGKKMIGWDEIFQPELPEGIVIQSWRGQASLAESSRRGYSGILSYGYYLDHMRPASFHYEMDPLGNEAEGLSEEEKSRILGGEACMWAEFINSENIESRIWPRTAAIAERLWSPADVNDTADLYRRMEIQDREFHALGLNYRTLYTEKLQGMAGNIDIQPLILFADLLKPPSLAVRKEARTYDSRTPLNRLVDILMPESRLQREFSTQVDNFLVSGNGAIEDPVQIRKRLDEWLANDTRVKPILEKSYLLKEVSPLADTVAELCRYSLEAISYLDSARKPPEEWRQKTASLIVRAEKPQAEIYIAVLAPMKKLIEAAVALP